MFELINSNETPPCGWTYQVPETGMHLEESSLDALIKAIHAHLDLNNISYDPSQTYPAVIADICRRSPTGICKNFVNRFIARSREVQNGTIALAQIIRKGRGAFVSADIAEKRAETCLQCHYNIDNPGCSTCKGFRMVINNSKGKRSTKHDADLKTCGICKCFLETLVHMDVEVLKAATDRRTVCEYPEWCWKKQEIEGA